MSKNIYRVNKKSDLDEIMKNNFYKPICIVFLSKLTNSKIYDDLSMTLLTASKINTYNMTVIIDFDNFIDNIGYFSSIKNNIPYFMAFFKGKMIGSCEYSDNFIPLIINHMDQIHKSYLNKLMGFFNQENNDNQNIQQNQNDQIPNNNFDRQDNINNEIEDDNVVEEFINDNDESNGESNDESNGESNDESNGENIENREELENHDIKNKNEKKGKKKNKDNKKSLKKKVEDNFSNFSNETNNTEVIQKKKEKLKKLKKLKELQELLNQ